MTKRIYKIPALLVLFSSSAIWAGDSVQGYKVGSALFKPVIDVSETYNDNIYAHHRRRTSDFIGQVSPGFSLEAANSPHILRFATGFDHYWYNHHAKDNYTNYSVGANGRYKFDDSMFWDTSASYRFLHSSRGDSSLDPGDRPTRPLPYNLVNAETSLYKRIQKFTMKPRLSLVNYEYETVVRENGVGFLNQDGRNRIENTYGVVLGYDLPYKSQLFVEIEGNGRHYRRPTNLTITNGLNRTSHGSNGLVGVQYRPNTNILARLGGGYMRQVWNNKTFRKVSEWNAIARLDWKFNKDNTSMSAMLRRAIDEVTDNNSSAAVRTDVTAYLAHNLSEKIIGKVSGRYVRYDFRGGLTATGGASDRRDQAYRAKVAFAYKYTDKVAFTADYSYTNNKSNIITSNYKINTVMVGIKFGIFDKNSII